eukprot:scaffold5946_cov169-Amphora_coffeaeformis.AAC.1
MYQRTSPATTSTTTNQYKHKQRHNSTNNNNNNNTNYTNCSKEQQHQQQQEQQDELHRQRQIQELLQGLYRHKKQKYQQPSQVTTTAATTITTNDDDGNGKGTRQEQASPESSPSTLSSSISSSTSPQQDKSHEYNNNNHDNNYYQHVIQSLAVRLHHPKKPSSAAITTTKTTISSPSIIANTMGTEASKMEANDHHHVDHHRDDDDDSNPHPHPTTADNNSSNNPLHDVELMVDTLSPQSTSSRNSTTTTTNNKNTSRRQFRRQPRRKDNNNKKIVVSPVVSPARSIASQQGIEASWKEEEETVQWRMVVGTGAGTTTTSPLTTTTTTTTTDDQHSNNAIHSNQNDDHDRSSSRRRRRTSTGSIVSQTSDESARRRSASALSYATAIMEEHAKNNNNDNDTREVVEEEEPLKHHRARKKSARQRRHEWLQKKKPSSSATIRDISSNNSSAASSMFLEESSAEYILGWQADPHLQQQLPPQLSSSSLGYQDARQNDEDDEQEVVQLFIAADQDESLLEHLQQQSPSSSSSTHAEVVWDETTVVVQTSPGDTATIVTKPTKSTDAPPPTMPSLSSIHNRRRQPQTSRGGGGGGGTHYVHTTPEDEEGLSSPGSIRLASAVVAGPGGEEQQQQRIVAASSLRRTAAKPWQEREVSSPTAHSTDDDEDDDDNGDDDSMTTRPAFVLPSVPIVWQPHDGGGDDDENYNDNRMDDEDYQSSREEEGEPSHIQNNAVGEASQSGRGSKDKFTHSTNDDTQPAATSLPPQEQQQPAQAAGNSATTVGAFQNDNNDANTATATASTPSGHPDNDDSSHGQPPLDEPALHALSAMGLLTPDTAQALQRSASQRAMASSSSLVQEDDNTIDSGDDPSNQPPFDNQKGKPSPEDSGSTNKDAMTSITPDDDGGALDITSAPTDELQPMEDDGNNNREEQEAVVAKKAPASDGDSPYHTPVPSNDVEAAALPNLSPSVVPHQLFSSNTPNDGDDGAALPSDNHDENQGIPLDVPEPLVTEPSSPIDATQGKGPAEEHQNISGESGEESHHLNTPQTPDTDVDRVSSPSTKNVDSPKVKAPSVLHQSAEPSSDLFDSAGEDEDAAPSNTITGGTDSTALPNTPGGADETVGMQKTDAETGKDTVKDPVDDVQGPTVEVLDDIKDLSDVSESYEESFEEQVIEEVVVKNTMPAIHALSLGGARNSPSQTAALSKDFNMAQAEGEDPNITTDKKLPPDTFFDNDDVDSSPPSASTNLDESADAVVSIDLHISNKPHSPLHTSIAEFASKDDKSPSGAPSDSLQHDIAKDHTPKSPEVLENVASGSVVPQETSAIPTRESDSSSSYTDYDQPVRRDSPSDAPKDVFEHPDVSEDVNEARPIRTPRPSSCIAEKSSPLPGSEKTNLTQNQILEEPSITEPTTDESNNPLIDDAGEAVFCADVSTPRASEILHESAIASLLADPELCSSPSSPVREPYMITSEQAEAVEGLKLPGVITDETTKVLVEATLPEADATVAPKTSQDDEAPTKQRLVMEDTTVAVNGTHAEAPTKQGLVTEQTIVAIDETKAGALTEERVVTGETTVAVNGTQAEAPTKQGLVTEETTVANEAKAVDALTAPGLMTEETARFLVTATLYDVPTEPSMIQEDIGVSVDTATSESEIALAAKESHALEALTAQGIMTEETARVLIKATSSLTVDDGDYSAPIAAATALSDEERLASNVDEQKTKESRREDNAVLQIPELSVKSAKLAMSAMDAKAVAPMVSTEEAGQDRKVKVNAIGMASQSLHESDSAVDLSTVDSWKLVVDQAKERMAKSSGHASEADSFSNVVEQVFGATSENENPLSSEQEKSTTLSHSDSALSPGNTVNDDFTDAAHPANIDTANITDQIDPAEAKDEFSIESPWADGMSEPIDSIGKQKPSPSFDATSQLTERAIDSQHPHDSPKIAALSTEYDYNSKDTGHDNNEPGGRSQVDSDERSPVLTQPGDAPPPASPTVTQVDGSKRLSGESSAAPNEEVGPQALPTGNDTAEQSGKELNSTPSILSSLAGEQVPKCDSAVPKSPPETSGVKSPILSVVASSLLVGDLDPQTSEDSKLLSDAEHSAAPAQQEQQVTVPETTSEFHVPTPVPETPVRKISTETAVVSNLPTEVETAQTASDVSPPASSRRNDPVPEESEKKESEPLNTNPTTSTASTEPSTQVESKKKEELSTRSTSTTSPSSESEEGPNFISGSNERHPPSGTVSLADSSITDASPNTDFGFKPAFTPNASIFRRQNSSPSNLVNYKPKPLRDLLRRDLRSPDEAVVERALQQITIDCFYDQSARSLIARTGGLLSIIGAMEDHPENPRIQIAACQALEKLALDAENERAVSELGGIDCILGAMMSHFDNIRVQESSWSALQNLTCSNALTEMTFDSTDGGMTMLVRAFEQHASNSAVAMHASATLANLCIPNAERTEHIVAADGIVTLAKALQQHWSDEVARSEISHSLERLCESISSRPVVDDDDLAASARF